MKEIESKIDMQRWFASGLVGVIAGFIPWAGIVWGLESLGIDTTNGSLLIGMFCASCGGAYTYHGLIAD